MINTAVAGLCPRESGVDHGISGQILTDGSVAGPRVIHTSRDLNPHMRRVTLASVRTDGADRSAAVDTAPAR